MDFCSPAVTRNSDYSCFTYADLVAIANAYNEYIKNAQLCENVCENVCVNVCALRKPIAMQTNFDDLYKSINERLSQLCNKEFCWIDLDFVSQVTDAALRKKLKTVTFKPQAPPGRYDWLNTNDINAVLVQYEQKFSDFTFLGALPSDFFKLVNMNYNSLKRYALVGIVFNLDTHDKTGSHWVAFVIDNKNKNLEYFDSVGDPPNKIISKFISKLRKIGYNDYELRINTTVHQTKNTECGVYSIYYTIGRLKGISSDKLFSKVVGDSKMNKFRDYIFRPRA